MWRVRLPVEDKTEGLERADDFPGSKLGQLRESADCNLFDGKLFRNWVAVSSKAFEHQGRGFTNVAEEFLSSSAFGKAAREGRHNSDIRAGFILRNHHRVGSHRPLATSR